MVSRVDENAALLAGNNLLRAVRPADAAILNPYLEPFGARGQIIHELGDPVRIVYFPCGPSLISYLVVLQNGMAVETALVGREGAIGGIVSRGWLPAFARAEVQFPGRSCGCRLPTSKRPNKSLPLSATYSRGMLTV